MKVFMQSRSKMVVFQRIHQKQHKNSISKVGPSKIHWDAINTKELISEMKK